MISLYCLYFINDWFCLKLGEWNIFHMTLPKVNTVHQLQKPQTIWFCGFWGCEKFNCLKYGLYLYYMIWKWHYCRLKTNVENIFSSVAQFQIKMSNVLILCCIWYWLTMYFLNISLHNCGFHSYYKYKLDQRKKEMVIFYLDNKFLYDYVYVRLLLWNFK